MNVSLSWLREYVAVEMDPSALSDALTMVGLEVEAMEDRYRYLRTVRVGKIGSTAPHPQAHHLCICRVEAGDRSLSVVCGAPNVRVGLRAPVALDGTRLPGGATVRAGVIRGVTSEAMLCSEAELGLGADTAGIMELPTSYRVGEALSTAMGLSDPVFEIGLTPNRADCLSILGVAREVAAITGAAVTPANVELPRSGPPIEQLTSVTIQAPHDCPRYAARVLQGLRVGPSPFWLQDRLLSVGLRPINNVVDVTNFVMMETGQPLHAFDFDRLEEHRIVVRSAREGEVFVTLDGQEKRLSAQALLICDGRKPVALAGVMGGLNSEISDATRNVLIESAHFNPRCIRRTAKALGYNTQASHRFERGVDPDGVIRAADRTAQIMLQVAGGTLAQGAIDANPLPLSKKEIVLSAAKTNRILGTCLGRDQMVQLLRAIAMETEILDQDRVRVFPPTFRVDVDKPIDLVEEVARLWGYDRIPTTSPLFPAESTPPSRLMVFRRSLSRHMVGLGFMEAVNYSFTRADAPDRLMLPPEDPRTKALAILNPLTEDQAVMRTSLTPCLLEAMSRNLRQQNRNLRLFEIGKVFIARQVEELPEEREMLCALWTGSRDESSWHWKETPCDFYDIKGVADSLLETLKIEEVFFTQPSAGPSRYLRPGYGAGIRKGGEEIGWLGEVRREVFERFECNQPPFLLELDLERLLAAVPETVDYKPLPRFPATTRDVTLILDASFATDAVLRHVKGLEERWLQSLHIFDVYQGDPIPSGKKSVSFRIVYQSQEETLEDLEVNRLHERITGELVRTFHATLPQG